MYIPKSFNQSDLAVLHAFIQEHNFATLVSQTADELIATHLPLMLDTTRGEYGTLLGHMAKANSHWKSITQTSSLVMFHGPHTYISPNWYETHPSVPTWNYTVVHAYGTARIIDNPDEVQPMLETLVNHHEAGFSPAWEMDLPSDYMATMMQAIVAFEIPITRLQGKFKLSQNRSQEDQLRVMEALGISSYPPDRDVSTLMQKSTELKQD
jgi:transcriptional regulator